jgi:glucans biosynthesis protein C
MQTGSAAAHRQFGLDWLRIGAFGLLIFYHIGMFFVPWDWHVKTSVPMDWVEWPMLAVNPWRLSLLFVISGIASRLMLSRLASAGGFAGSRSWRLLVPLIAGMTLFVVPQPWLELHDQGRYNAGLLHFWSTDYFRFDDSLGTPVPTWNHLWFVVYLWVYSMLLALAAALPASVRAWVQQAFDRAFGGWRLYLLPVAWMTAARMLLYPAYGETHALVDDPYAHAIYGFAFAFGVGLARSQPAWQSIASHWKPALVIAAMACILLFASMFIGQPSLPMAAMRAVARSTLAWATIVGLIGMALRHLHHDNRARRYLTEAIFPYYIVHQTIIVVVGYYLTQAGVGAGLEFVDILVATLAGCALTFEIARRIGWLRPLLGLKIERRSAQSL